MEFNREQQQAMEHKDGPMLVLAGPGSGKTEVIIRRTRKLIQNYQVAPSSILVVTFTKAAAMESFTVFSGRRTVSHRQISPVKK